MLLSPIKGPLGLNRARHLLWRLTFGPGQQQIMQFASMNIQQALSQLFDKPSMPDAPILPYDPDGKMPDNYAWTSHVNMGNESGLYLQRSLLCWWVGHMQQTHSALEKLVFFLHTVITVKSEAAGNTRDVYWQNTLFRQYLINDLSDTNPLFNRYKQLIRKMMIDSAMLHFLDGRLNVKGRPNENFAREMFELFTIGKGETKASGDYTNYTEEDIRAAARVLTGWTTAVWEQPDAFTPDAETGIPRGKARIHATTGIATAHDNDPKTFSAAFGGHTIQPAANPPTAESMEDELRQLVDMIYSQEQAARYFCRRLYRFFVHWRIDSTIEEEVIGPLAQTFTTSGFRMRPVLEQLFSSELFFEAAPGIGDNKYGAMIKSPLELIIGTINYLQLPLAPVNTQEHINQLGPLIYKMGEMGLHLMSPFDVAGYEAYHQAPNYSRNWITTNTLAVRYAFIDALLGKRLAVEANLLAWAESAETGITDQLATTPENINGQNYATSLIEHLAGQLFPYADRDLAITRERYLYFARYHLGGLEFENWVFNWMNRNNGNMNIQMDATARLRNILNALMQSPEYQLF